MRPSWRRRIMYSGITLACLLVGGTAWAGYEYYQLLPNHHFRQVPVLASGGTTNSTSVDASGSTPSSTANTSGSTPANTLATSVAQTKSTANTTPPGTTPGTAETFNILLIGSDIRGPNTPGHSDSMMLVHVNVIAGRYDILSLPRDARVYMKGYGFTKLTSVQYMAQASQGITPGIQDAIATVAQLTGVPINYYMETDYWGLQDVVNALGGINMNVPFNVTLTHPWYAQDQGITIPAGVHFLNGRMVTEVVHERYSLSNGDYGRQQLQEDALLGIVKAALMPTNITKLPALVQAFPHFLIGTNMSISDLLSLGLTVKHFHSSDVHYYQVPGKAIVAYDDILRAYNDEISLDMQALQQIVQAHFQD